MNENGEINGTPTDSEKMDISEVSDIVSPTSDQSLCEMVDNAGSASGFTSCESHPLDNAAVLATTSRTTTTTSQDTSMSQASNSRERIPLDLSLDLDMSLRGFNGADVSSPAESEDDPSSVYAAEVADDYQDVRLRKDATPGGFVLERRNSRRGRPVQAEFVESANCNHSLRIIAAPSDLQDLDQSNATIESTDQSHDFDTSLSQSESASFGGTPLKINGSQRVTNESQVKDEKLNQSNDGVKKSNFESGEKESNSEQRYNLNHTQGTTIDINQNTGNTNDPQQSSNNNRAIFYGNGNHTQENKNVAEGASKTAEISQHSQPSSTRDIDGAKEQTSSDDESGGSESRHLEVNVQVYDRAGSQTASQSGGRRRIRLSSSLLKDEAESSDDSPDIDLDTLADSGDELEDSIMERLSSGPEPIAELTAAEERADERGWRTCRLNGADRAIDMRVVEPYKRVLSHGGYLAAGSHNAIIIFSACFLPDRSRTDYAYVMDNLFFYVVSTLQQLVTQDYVLVYLHGGAQRSCMPTFSWLKRCYHMLDRRLRKDLKALYLVHPTFWLKTLVMMTRPFISTKFSRKLSFVGSLEELRCILPLEQASIPDRVKQYEQIRSSLTGN